MLAPQSSQLIDHDITHTSRHILGIVSCITKSTIIVVIVLSDIDAYKISKNDIEQMSKFGCEQFF